MAHMVMVMATNGDQVLISLKRRKRKIKSYGLTEESRNIQPNRLTELPPRSTEKMTSSFQGNGSYWQKQQDMKQGNALGSIEGKDWSPSYLKLGSFCLPYQVS
jgi:hypothetical protein